MASSGSAAVQDASHDPPSPPSPTASFYDVSDDEENEYSTIKHSKSSRGVKLLYAKSKVYGHPSQSARDNIPGYIALVQQKPTSETTSASTAAGSSNSRDSSERNSILLAWVPEGTLSEDTKQIYAKVELSDADPGRNQSHLVPQIPVTTQPLSVGSTAYAVPLSHVYSLLVRPPSPGWWHGSIIVNTRAGESFPAMFFHDSECQSTIQQRKRLQRDTFDISANGAGMFWGGDEVLRWLRKHVNLERSTQEPSVYLIDPSEQDRVGFGAGGKPTPEKVRNALEGKSRDENAGRGGKKQQNQMDPVMKALTQARWNFLEKMSQVTTFTRRTAQAVAENKNVPPQVRRLMQDPQVQSVSDDFDSARLYLARWAMGIAEQSERERNQRIWTAKDVLELEESEVGQFEVLDVDSMSLADRRKPVTLQEWNGFFNARTGRLEKTPDEVKERIFHGGLNEDDGVRKEAWLFLLGVYEWDSSKEGRHARMNSLRDEYIRLKGSWWERLVDEEGTLEEREWWKEQRNRIEKDVHRTDRHLPLFAGEDIPHPDPDSPFAEAGTNVHLEQMKDMLLTYNEYNRDLGYVQGMSDLLAPIYAVEQDDAVAFWGFVGFMERMERNFLRDQSGMRLQLLTLDQLCQLLDPKLYEHLQKLDSTNFFFFFRMLLVWFKREFEFPAILRLWEALWTDYTSSNYHLFIAMAILDKHRNVIIDHLKGFDEVLKYVNELSGTIDLPSTLVRAEALFRRFQKMVEAIDRKNSFPMPSLRQRTAPLAPAATVSRPGADGKPRRPSQASSSSTTPATQGQSSTSASSSTGNGPRSSTSTPTSTSAAVAAAAARREGGGRGGRATSSSATASGRDNATTNSDRAGAAAAADSSEAQERVITPELRSLLSREVPKLKKDDVREHGGGVGS